MVTDTEATEPPEPDSPARLMANRSSMTSEATGDTSVSPSRDVEKAQAAAAGPASDCPETTGPSLVRTISRQISRTISRSNPPPPGPPPDGGFQAWLQCAVAHIVVFNSWGYINTFGVFQDHYEGTLGVSPSAISWVGSVQIWLLFFVGSVSGRATDAGYFKHTLLLGSLLQLIGVYMTSICTEYWQLFLAQGLCQGLGNGLAFCPCVAVVAAYFQKRRAVAIALCATGTATGGLVYPAMVETLLPRLGFGWTVRCLGLVMLITQGFAFILGRSRLPPRKSGPLVEWRAFREPAYTLFAVGAFISFLGLYFAFYYVGTYARTELGASSSDAINLLLVANGVGIPGRLIPALFADWRIGPLNGFIMSSTCCGVLVLAWIRIWSLEGLYAFAAVYGFFGAAMTGLFPPTIASLTDDLTKLGTRIGMIFSVVSFSVLTGPPIAGALIAADDGRYLAAQLFAGLTFLVGASVLFGARTVRVGLRLLAKV